MNTVIYSASGSSAGVGFAVPADSIKRIVPELIEHGKVVRPGLGIGIANENIRYHFGLESGVVIAQLDPKGPAATAGLKGMSQDAFARFLDDGRVCLTNNAAERALRCVPLGRKAWLFCGSDRGGQRAAVLYTMIQTARLNDVDPQAWLADVLARIADHPVGRLDELLPWNWRKQRGMLSQAA